MHTIYYDAIIIGSGVAGLAVALHLSPQHRVLIINKNDLNASASQYAQGGIAAVLHEPDCFQLHENDTLNCGCGLCDLKTVHDIITYAPKVIDWLSQQGVSFTRRSNMHYHLTQEGGHSCRRVVHVLDHTGASVMQALIQKLNTHHNITIMSHTMAIDLITKNERCLGVRVLDTRAQSIFNLYAHVVVLATGGASSVYAHTTHPHSATGDGMAMAFRGGAHLADLEFQQFHPTCFFFKDKKHPFLISESLRGEGAFLRSADGIRFMKQYDTRAELAPRDITTRAIFQEMQAQKSDHVFLDMTHKHHEEIRLKFPNIYQSCLTDDVDITRDLIPVCPAAHYSCGGVVVDKNGQTNLFGLYAVGETACTGLHGANRLASNSLLECLVLAQKASEHILDTVSEKNSYDHSRTHEIVPVAPCILPVQHLKKILQQQMWHHVGIVRSESGLLCSMEHLESCILDVEHSLSVHRIDAEFLEYRNLVQLSRLMTHAALQRRESRGVHYRIDYPEPWSVAQHTLIIPRVGSDFELRLSAQLKIAMTGNDVKE